MSTAAQQNQSKDQQQAKKSAGKVRAYRVLAGSHFGPGPSGPGHEYRARRADDPPDYRGDLVESEVDLVDQHNQGLSRKFERVEAPQALREFPLEQMTLSQLLAVAADEGLDLKGVAKKEDAVKAIQAHRDSGAE